MKEPNTIDIRWSERLNEDLFALPFDERLINIQTIEKRGVQYHNLGHGSKFVFLASGKIPLPPRTKLKRLPIYKRKILITKSHGRYPKPQGEMEIVSRFL